MMSIIAPDSLVLLGFLYSRGVGDCVPTILDHVGFDVVGQLELGVREYSYYTHEMGDGIVRVWAACRRPLVGGGLVALKRWSVWEEGRWAIDGKRRVNIDPGWLTEYSLILVSSKNYAHRIPIEMGIYGEVELIWKNKEWQVMPWTYPDYQLPVFLDWLTSMRRRIKTLV